MGRQTDEHRFAVLFRDDNPHAKERVGVYEEALAFTVLIDELVEKSEARFHLKDLLDKSATAVAMRIAQAGAELNKLDRRRQYRVARRAATDCAAVLDILARRATGSPALLGAAKRAIISLVAQLATLAAR
ncbi:MAG TPA: four helix bundle protein [Kofleriaceae bacterium]|jgi:four helix bundle protein